MKLTNENFRGSWAGLPVAWTHDNLFDEHTYRGDVARCCTLGVPGIYSGGTTGEFYAMEFDEFQRVARATVEEAHAAGKPAMIGVSSTYTLGVMRRAAYAAEIGADAVQVALPFWMEVPDAAVIQFFREVSEAAGHLPLSIYETLRAKKALTLAQHHAIKAVLPNYLVVKSNTNTTGTTEEGCAALTELGINVFVGEGSLWSKLGPYGVAGACSAFVYYAPDMVLDLNRHLASQNWEQVAKGSKKLELLLNFMIGTFIPRGYYDSALDRIGGVAGGVLRTSLNCRGPYTHGDEADVLLLKEWYQKNLPEVFARIRENEAIP